MDTPGMRELQMSEVASGVAEVFDDIVAITLDAASPTAPILKSPNAPSERLLRKIQWELPASKGGGS